MSQIEITGTYTVNDWLDDDEPQIIVMLNGVDVTKTLEIIGLETGREGKLLCYYLVNGEKIQNAVYEKHIPVEIDEVPKITYFGHVKLYKVVK